MRRGLIVMSPASREKSMHLKRVDATGRGGRGLNVNHMYRYGIVSIGRESSKKEFRVDG